MGKFGGKDTLQETINDNRHDLNLSGSKKTSVPGPRHNFAHRVELQNLCDMTHMMLKSSVSRDLRFLPDWMGDVILKSDIYELLTRRVTLPSTASMISFLKLATTKQITYL